MDADSLRFWFGLVTPGALTAGLVPLVVYGLKWYWDRQRWHQYEELLHQWILEELVYDTSRRIADIPDGEWRAVAATLLRFVEVETSDDDPHAKQNSAHPS